MDLNGNKSTDFFELSMANGVYYIIRTNLSFLTFFDVILFLPNVTHPHFAKYNTQYTH